MNLVDVKDDSENQKFLAFCINSKNYGFEIIKVSEVIVLPEITPVPKVPYFVKGVINLRGQIIPLIDLALSLGLNSEEYDDETCVIIVMVSSDKGQKLVGFIVDCVSEVFEISATNIEPPSSCGGYVNDGFLLGIGKVKEKIIMLLDVDKIVSNEDSGGVFENNFEELVV